MVLNVATCAISIVDQKLGKSLYVFIILTYIPEYGFSATVFYRLRTESIIIRENMGHRKFAFRHFLRSIRHTRDIHPKSTSVLGYWVRSV